MLSISTTLTVEGAGKYYDRDNYYLESQGYYHGNLAGQLGLGGEVTEAAFKALLQGYDPTELPYKIGEIAEINGQMRQIIDIDEKNNVLLHGNPDNPAEEPQKSPLRAALTSSAGKKNRRAGIDMTFSAPKSVSILSYQDERIQAAFDKTVQDALNFTEQLYTQTRHKDKDGNIIFETTGNAAFAVFNHQTSRELDPQLHAHCVMMNLTQSETGKMMSMDYAKILQNNLLIGQYFRNTLALRMQELGYHVKNTDRKKGFFEVAGVSNGIIEDFSKRREQVIKRQKELRALKFKDLPENQLAAWAAERLQSLKNTPYYEERLQAEINNLKTSEDAVYAEWKDSELAVLATTDSRIAKKNVTKEYIVEQMNNTLANHNTSLSQLTENAQAYAVPPREKAAISEHVISSIESLTRTESAFTRESVMKKALKKGLCDYSYEELNAEFNRMLESGELVHLGDEYKPYNGETPLYTCSIIQAAEKENVELCSSSKTDICIDNNIANNFINETDNILHAKKVFSFDDKKFYEKLDGQTDENKKIIVELRNQFKKNKDSIAAVHDVFKNNETIKEFFDENGQGFTSGQKDALRQMVATKHQFSVIQGDAGTGKSFSMMFAKELLEGQGFSVRGLAPTGKATDELAKAAKLPKSMTIHKFILKWEKNPKFRTKFEKGKECFVVDESGMLGSLTANKFIKIAKEIEAKVVFVGDRKQFTAVEAGKFFIDLQTKTGTACAIMEDVMRQKTDQTKDIVKAISTADKFAKKGLGFDAKKQFNIAFNFLSGYNTVNPKARSRTKHYKIGQKLLFTSPGTNKNPPEGTNAEIIDVKKSVLTVKYTKNNGQEEIMNICPRQEHKKYEIYAKETERADRNYTNCIVELSDEDKRLQAVANDYLSCMSEGKDALVITATNDDRQKLNTIIRQTLTEQGTVKDVGEYTLLEPKSVSDPTDASLYQVGQVLEINNPAATGRKDKKIKVEIVETDEDKNTVTYRNAKGETETVNAYQFKKEPPSVFNQNEVTLGTNEKIAFLKNAKVKTTDGEEVDIRNGQLAQITSINKSGDVVAQIGEGSDTKHIKFNINKDYNNFTTAYALSSHKSQGMTVDKIIWHANTQKEISTNSFYVAITRCKSEVSVYTDNTETLQRKSQKEQEKYSTLDMAKSPNDNFEYDDEEILENNPINNEKIEYPIERTQTIWDNVNNRMNRNDVNLFDTLINEIESKRRKTTEAVLEYN